MEEGDKKKGPPGSTGIKRGTEELGELKSERPSSERAATRTARSMGWYTASAVLVVDVVMVVVVVVVVMVPPERERVPEGEGKDGGSCARARGDWGGGGCA